MMSVTHGQFSFDGNSFNVTSSGIHFDRRASYAELRALFDTSMPDRSHRPDYPAHWYSAQLLHYGLPFSDKKVIAKMRLLDALQDGSLKVPGEMVKLEQDLKKQWEKQDLEMRLQDAGLAVTGSMVGIENAHRPQLGSPFRPVSLDSDTTSSYNQPQKRKAATSRLQTARKKSRPEKPSIKPTQQAKNGEETPEISVNLQFNTQIANPSQEELKMSSFLGSRLPSDMVAVPDWVLKRPEQHAQILSHEQMIRAPPDTTRQNFGYDGADGADGADGSQDRGSPSHHSSQSSRTMKQFASLDLINGEYDIFSSDFEYSPEEVRKESNLALCLNGQEIWGEYSFGILHGILRMRQRPMRASQKQHSFEWRGYDVTEDREFRSCGEGWIRFLGDGEIEGEIDSSGWLQFEGQRISGQNTSRPRDLNRLKQQWQDLGW